MSYRCTQHCVSKNTNTEISLKKKRVPWLPWPLLLRGPDFTSSYI